MSSDKESQPNQTAGSRLILKVFGVGGAGGNIVEYMAQQELPHVEFFCVNTDSLALERCVHTKRISLGKEVTRGLGAGGDPELGRESAEHDEEALKKLCQGADIVFIAAGMGGGTGTGASPVIAKIARESGALVLGVVTMPFECEGNRRQKQAQYGLSLLKLEADGVICLPNQKIFKLIDEKTSLIQAFKIANDLLTQGIKSIWCLLNQPGLINVDFADICTVLRGRHTESCFAIGEAQGSNRARDVIDILLSSPLLDGGQNLNDSDAVLVSILGGPSMTMSEVDLVMEQIKRQCENAHIIMGAAIDSEKEECISVTLIASTRSTMPEHPSRSAESENEIDIGHQQALSYDEPDFDTQFFKNPPETTSSSRYIPPAPQMSSQKKQELYVKQKGRKKGALKTVGKFRQGMLPLEIVSKGRFQKSQPTTYQGEDLDVPTYIRRGAALN